MINFDGSLNDSWYPSVIPNKLPTAIQTHSIVNHFATILHNAFKQFTLHTWWDMRLAYVYWWNSNKAKYLLPWTFFALFYLSQYFIKLIWLKKNNFWLFPFIFHGLGNSFIFESAKMQNRVNLPKKTESRIISAGDCPGLPL